MKYMVVIEESEAGFSAHAPDLPGCVAAGETREVVLEFIKGAIEFHIEGLIKAGEPVPPPSSASEIIEVNAAQQIAPTPPCSAELIRPYTTLTTTKSPTRLT